MKQRRRHIWPIPVIAAALLLLAGAVLLQHLNRWQLSLRLLGEEELTLEFGEPYREAGAEAVFGGELFLPEYRRPEVRIQGEVNTGETGVYTLAYTAEYRGFAEKKTRLVWVVDTVPPELTLRESPGSYTLPGREYAEEGYTAWDNADGDITDRVERRVEGNRVYYRVEDRSGNEARAERRIRYDDPIPPELILTEGSSVTLPYRTPFADPGYTAWDNADGDLTDRVTVTGEVDPEIIGDYTLRYAVEDRWGNRTEVERSVSVVPLLQMRYTEPEGKVIYLTFDDGPSKYTQQLLDVLEKYGVKVTFFVVDYGYTDMIAKEAAAGHSVGVHSVTHRYSQIYASEEAFFADVEKMNGIIHKQTGAYTDILRFPGGSSNTVSSFNPGIMTRLTKAVRERGYQYFDWNVSSGDAGETTSTDQVYLNVINGVQKQDVSVVLMHDSLGYSVAAVERIIQWGLENGYTFLPLHHDSPAAHHR